MKEDSVLINIARGSIVDEPELIKAPVRPPGGRGAERYDHEAAGTREPPVGHTRRHHRPHSASTVEEENEKLTDIFVDNLQRYIEGRPFRNLLDKNVLY